EFPRIDPAVICLIHDGGDRVLLGRQAVWPAGMFSLLAGFVEVGESLERCVEREVREEVGIELPDAAVLGLLDDYPTRSGYVITPVVIWGGGRLDPRPSPDEVVAVYR
ncbi:NUDIX domain-containing protein, partial [Mycobacterium tuberculosis]|uniref:NUDIX domain-containing protein n=1 Tax=Mycobacterium tuberculosis TaxID=1773 RepID=UPI001F1C5F75